MEQPTVARLGRNDAARAIAVSFVATASVWVVTSALITVGMGVDLAKLAACGMAIAFLIAVPAYREQIVISRLTVALLLAGIAIGGLVCFIRYQGADIQISNSGGAAYIAVHVLLVAVAAPVFEEIVVRRLLFRGTAFYLGGPIGAIVVSVLFGASHAGAFWIAFLASVILCGMTCGGVSTFNRSVIHGAYNLSFATTLLLLARHG